MIRKRTQENRKLCHVPLKVYKELRLYGNGNFQSGLKKANQVVTCLNKNNNGVDHIKQQILIKDADQLMDHLMDLYPVHWRSFKNFMPFFDKFLRTGNMQFNILKGHKETTLDEIKGDGKGES